MTTTTEVTYVHSFYDRNLLERALPNLVHNLWAQIKDIPMHNSNVIVFRKYSALALATTPLVQGVTPAGKNLAITDISATVLQYGDFVEVTDFLLDTSLDPVLLAASDVLGEQAGQTLDVIIRDVLNAGTSVRYADNASPKVNASRVEITTADVIAADEIRLSINDLKLQNAKPITSMVNPDNGYGTTPVAPCYVSIVHPNTTLKLKAITGFQPVETYANKANLLPGEVGKFEEARFVETTFAKVFTDEGAGGTVDVYSTLFLGQNAYGVSRISGKSMENIIKAVGTSGTADPLNQRGTSGWKASLAAKIIQQLFMVRLEHAV